LGTQFFFPFGSDPVFRSPSFKHIIRCPTVTPKRWVTGFFFLEHARPGFRPQDSRPVFQGPSLRYRYPPHYVCCKQISTNLTRFFVGATDLALPFNLGQFFVKTNLDVSLLSSVFFFLCHSIQQIFLDSLFLVAFSELDFCHNFPPCR